MKKFLIKQRYFWGGIISIIIIGYMILRLDWQDVRSLFSDINWFWVFSGFGIYYLNYVFRTLRFQYLLDNENLPFLQMLGVTNQYGMFLYLMPAKFGEVTFPLLVRTNLGMDISFSTGVLIAARIFDFFAISLILPAAVVPYWNHLHSGIRIGSIIFSIMVFAMFGGFVLAIKNKDAIRRKFLESEYQSRFFNWLKKFVSGAVLGMETVQKNNLYVKIFLLTIAIWLCINLNLFMIILSLGYQINLYQVVVVSIIMIPITLFPIQGFANLGSHELGWVTAFSLFGYDYQDALNVAISSHFLSVFFVMLLGLIGTLLLSGKRIFPSVE